MTGYLRFPAFGGQHLAFVCEDDLWLATRDGTGARRLTTAGGHVLNPVFTPDGAGVAFSSDVDGVQQVHVVPVEGGSPAS